MSILAGPSPSYRLLLWQGHQGHLRPIVYYYRHDHDHDHDHDHEHDHVHDNDDDRHDWCTVCCERVKVFYNLSPIEQI